MWATNFNRFILLGGGGSLLGGLFKLFHILTIQSCEVRAYIGERGGCGPTYSPVYSYECLRDLPLSCTRSILRSLVAHRVEGSQSSPLLSKRDPIITHHHCKE